MTSPLVAASLRSQIRACWLGKNVGGTLGGPHEGKSGPLELRFYDPVPDGMMPNDDLDLQLVWLYHLRREGVREVTPDLLAEAWERHVRFPFDEYGYGLRNAHLGIRGAERGAVDNWFGEGMGAAIRSELWACLCPGNPARAAGFAWADAVTDHSGDGVWAEVFFAALQAAAFGGGEVEALIGEAERFLPRESTLRAAIVDCVALWQASGDWLTVRDQLFVRYYNGNFTHVVVNVAFTLLGWLAGRGDFGRSLCIAVNCGLDTDCTGATLGALMGIHRPECITDDWLAPIGEEIVVSPEIVGIDAPATVDELVAQTLELKDQLSDAQPSLGAVHRCEPMIDNDFFHLEGRILAVDDLDVSGAVPDLTRGALARFEGHWFRLNQEFEGKAWLLVQFEVNLPESKFLEVMTFAKTEVVVWLGGTRINHFTLKEATRDAYYSASPHRGGCYVTPLPLEEITRQALLTVAYRRPAKGEGVDAVVAVADSKTHLWVADAVARKD